MGRNKDGSLSKASRVLSPGEFRTMLAYTKIMEKELKEKMYEGEVQAEPYELNGATGCDHCECRDICGFDPRIDGCRYRQLEKYSLEEAVVKMRLKTGGSGGKCRRRQRGGSRGGRKKDREKRRRREMATMWTAEQQKVIDLRNRNILVSAAAGSGKTAVLVERIIQRITDEREPVDVDRMLIVTYTEAAASEMKERIAAAIEKQLEQRPGDARLEQQAALIHTAPITTIHSFCLSVIRDHFHVIGIDPGFRIVEEGELKLLKQDVLDELLEECYEKGDEEFLEFTEKFGRGKNDRRIEELILKLYEFSCSYPCPGKWLDSCVMAYKSEDMLSSGFVKNAELRVRRRGKDIGGILNRALKICEEPDGRLYVRGHDRIGPEISGQDYKSRRF